MDFNNSICQTDESIQVLERLAFQRGLAEDHNVGDPAPTFAGSSKSEPAACSPGVTRNGTESARILVIDDDAVFREMLVQMLRQEGYEVSEAADGSEGLRLQFENPFDLIISDIIMPEKEGIEMIIEIRKKFTDARFIVVSGGGWYGTEIDFDMARKLGAATLEKPFSRDDITTVIRDVFNSN